MAKPPESNWKIGTGMEDDGPAPDYPHPPVAPESRYTPGGSAASSKGGGRLIVTIAIIIAVAAVLGFYLVDILKTATGALNGR